MKSFELKPLVKQLLADTYTPVSLYLRFRDKFPGSILLESSDYHGTDDIFSYICCRPVASFVLQNGVVSMNYPDGSTDSITLEATSATVTDMLADFASSFKAPASKFSFITSGLFGYMSYDAVRHYEDVEVKTFETDYRSIPDIQYHVHRYVLAFNHFNNELTIVDNFPDFEDGTDIEYLEGVIKSRNFAAYDFKTEAREESNFTDSEFLEVIKKGQYHCHRGDVFQVVLSRRFSRQYSGDDFNVYRSLRSINPSPYLFYFDYGNFRLFGSSPEAQIVIKNNRATIYPIAGTFRRTGNDIEDYDLAKKLLDDPKENAEHVMLVDLARNDLSRHCHEVKVATYKEVQYYSHVIHLVSKVTGRLNAPEEALKIVADTFPAGTLSGAPKVMAMKIINNYEHGNRGYYGGCIGYMGFNGDFNSAIMIRTILSKDNVLYYQAGAGVVELSVPENEKEEVNNKLAALKKAIESAEKFAKS